MEAKVSLLKVCFVSKFVPIIQLALIKCQMWLNTLIIIGIELMGTLWKIRRRQTYNIICCCVFTSIKLPAQEYHIVVVLF